MTTITSQCAARSVEVIKVFSSEFPGVHFPRHIYANAYPARIFPFRHLISPSLLFSLSARLFLFFIVFFSRSISYIRLYVRVKSCTPAMHPPPLPPPALTTVNVLVAVCIYLYCTNKCRYVRTNCLRTPETRV